MTALMTACGNGSGKTGCILPKGVELREGDVVFRRGGGLESHAVLTMDAHGQYSHVGIVVDTMGRKMIVHAVPGEPDFDGDVDRVKLDEIGKFFMPIYANKGAVKRMDDSIVAKRAANIALGIFRKGMLFDNDYNANDTTEMYCTEFVMYAYDRAGVRLVTTEPHSVSLPIVNADIYYPSDVYESKLLKPIISF